MFGSLLRIFKIVLNIIKDKTLGSCLLICLLTVLLQHCILVFFVSIAFNLFHLDEKKKQKNPQRNPTQLCPEEGLKAFPASSRRKKRRKKKREVALGYSPPAWMPCPWAQCELGHSVSQVRMVAGGQELLVASLPCHRAALLPVLGQHSASAPSCGRTPAGTGVYPLKAALAAPELQGPVAGHRCQSI